MTKLTKLALAASLLLPISAFAIPVSSLVGDKDCFGVGGACVEDGSTWLPGAWASSPITEASDPAFTDRLIFTGSTQSWQHTIAAQTYSTASLRIRTAGIADITGPYGVYVDGVLAGFFPLDNIGHILVETFTFNFNASLLSDGLATISFTPNVSDYWAIDYSEIIADSVTKPTSAPEPASLALLGMGLLGMAVAKKKKAA